MSHSVETRRHMGVALACVVALTLGACSGADDTAPITNPDRLLFTSDQVRSLDSSGQVIVQANPGNPNLKALVDSTLMVLTAGVEAKRVDVSTNLTTAPLYFVGVHRVVSRATGSFATWTLVGMDNPSRLANLIEVSGFAQSATATAPTGVSGTIGDGTGVVNATLLQVAAGGAVTEWLTRAGTVTIMSDAPTAACPGFTPTATVTCGLETMHVHFTATAPAGPADTGTRSATLATDTDIPAMRLTYTP